MKGLRVFVTGGAGVIGMELVPRLVDLGADILVGDLKPLPNIFRGSVRYRQGDLNELTEAELQAFDPEIIIHLAATFERSTETSAFWDENFHHNVKLSHHLMGLARNCLQLKRVVFASSYLIYDPSFYQFDSPQANPVKLAEDNPIRPRNLTGMAKLSHEQELQFLASFPDCRFSTLCVRIYRGYGCRSRDVISRWIRSLLKGDAITVYRPEGFFDYIYAADSAEGLIRLSMCDKASGIVNLGTGCSRRVAEVVNLMRLYFPSAVIENADSDIPFEASEASTDKLESLIGWRPTKTLEETIPEMIAFEREQLRLAEVTRQLRKSAESVLLTSASRKIPLLRALKQAIMRIDRPFKVVAGDIDPMAIARFEADEFWQMPRLTDDILSELIESCHARSISIVLPSRDSELDFWACHRQAFLKEGIEVIVSSPEAIALCRDKLAFARFGHDLDLSMIPTDKTPDSFEGVRFVVKERFGAGSRGLGLNLDYQQAVEHAKGLDEPVFQPFVPGPEISIDGWVNARGQVVGVVLRRRDLVVSGESQVTTTFRDAALEREAIQILTALQLRGPVVLQAIVVDGRLQVIECNPRFGGASTASIAAGLDSLYWSLTEAIGDTEFPEFHRISGEARQIRMSVDRVIYDSDF